MNPRLRMLILAVGLAVAGWLAIFGDKTPVGETVDAVAVAPRPAPARAGAVPAGGQDAPVAAADVAPAPLEAEALAPGQVRRPVSRAGWFDKASVGVDLFAAPPQPAPAVVHAPPPPEAPPLRLIGRLEEQGRWTYFLEHENRVYPLRSGETADGFRLVSASATSLAILRLADQARFSIPLDVARP